MKSKKVKKFRDFKIPRYLPGQVEKAVLKSDLREYNQHRYNVFTAKPRVDDKPLSMNPHNYINAQRLVNDTFRLKEIDRLNKDMIKRINTINRMGGRVDSFNPIAYALKSKWRAHELKMREIVKDNKGIYNRISKAKSSYTTKDLDEFWKHIVEKLHYTCKFPIVFLGQKTLDQKLKEQLSISGDGLLAEVVEKLNRPLYKPLDIAKLNRCFMDFRVKEGVYLGRIVIELYHDYVPVTVQNFLSICCKENKLTYKNCPVHRAVPGQFIETGDITKGNGKGGTSIYGDTFAEENHKLKHTKAGVLSTIRVGNKVNNSQFSITLAPMEKLDGNRVVFGKVIKGNTTLCKISDLGRKFGRPVVPIIIHDCGKFIKGETPAFIRNFRYI